MLKKLMSIGAVAAVLFIAPTYAQGGEARACTASSCPAYEQCMLVCWKITGNHEVCALECSSLQCGDDGPPILP
ncbi:hypothetical protein [Brevundimonas sp.]|uniref:hypothetical protein n=1 Tax=Brevundimonas sp. TaxID=1871086 RepID=UPI0028A287CB|nr:hypothetical protein [Brevundimonas sp.]